jgi:hypothetical protein
MISIDSLKFLKLLKKSLSHNFGNLGKDFHIIASIVVNVSDLSEVYAVTVTLKSKSKQELMQEHNAAKFYA